MLTFLYEVETFPRVSAEQVLPSLETAFIASILPVLFPFRCGEPSSLTPAQEKQYQAITGVSSEPVDVVTGGMLSHERFSGTPNSMLSTFHL